MKWISINEEENKLLRDGLGFYAENKDNRVWGVYEDDYGTEARETLKRVGELNNTHKEQSNK